MRQLVYSFLDDMSTSVLFAGNQILTMTHKTVKSNDQECYENFHWHLMLFMTIQISKNSSIIARKKIIKKHFINQSWNLFHVSFWPKLKITIKSYKKLLNLVFRMTRLLCTCIKLVKKALELQKIKISNLKKTRKS